MSDILFSLYQSKEATENKDLSIENYIGCIKHGSNKELVERAREARSSGDSDKYKKLKGTSPVITGSCSFESGQPKSQKNVKSMTGLIVLDIDDEISAEKYYEIRNDKHTFIIHQSFSGTNYCVFVKIDSLRFRESFDALAEYYFLNFGVSVDQSCKNINRLRYMSFDEGIFHNDKSAKFVVKNLKRHEAPKEINYIFHGEDFDFIIEQIQDKTIDLCQEDYFAYMRIGMAIASKFGTGGLDTFKLICSYGGKYHEKKTERDYRGFCANSTGSCSIATFYYYCKEAGLDIYRQRTKDIINRVKIGKAQGTPTIQSIASVVETVHGFQINKSEENLVQQLIDSKNDYSKEANDGVTEIMQLKNYIVSVYEPTIDEVTNIMCIKGNVVYTDKQFNDIYIDCKDTLDFNVNSADVRAVLNSGAVRNVNLFNDFITENADIECEGTIKSLCESISPYNPYNEWAITRWLVGGVHNWTADMYDKLVCPLTLVLSSRQHGTGKTTFFRDLLPPELKPYFVEAKISGHNNDSMFKLCTSLICMDDEFGGTAFKDVKEYKALSDTNIVSQRRPYERESKNFKRRALLCGTSNSKDILKDVTGNRRILPVNVTSIDFNLINSVDRVKLIMEAYTLLKSGFDWPIYKAEDIAYIKENTEDNEAGLPAEDLFLMHFRFYKDDQAGFIREVVMNKGEILNHLHTWSAVKPSKYEIDDVYIKNNIDIGPHRNEFGKVKKGIKLYMLSSSMLNM